MVATNKTKQQRKSRNKSVPIFVCFLSFLCCKATRRPQTSFQASPSENRDEYQKIKEKREPSRGIQIERCDNDGQCSGLKPLRLPVCKNDCSSTPSMRNHAVLGAETGLAGVCTATQKASLSCPRSGNQNLLCPSPRQELPFAFSVGCAPDMAAFSVTSSREPAALACP